MDKELAWIPVIPARGEMEWQKNPCHTKDGMIVRGPDIYTQHSNTLEK
jgi:hypothetical protein